MLQEHSVPRASLFTSLMGNWDPIFITDSGCGCRGTRSPSGPDPARESSSQRQSQEAHAWEAAPSMPRAFHDRGCQTVHMHESCYLVSGRTPSHLQTYGCLAGAEPALSPWTSHLAQLVTFSQTLNLSVPSFPYLSTKDKTLLSELL